MNAKELMVRRLQDGETITGYREGGNSMTPLIQNRQPVDIVPVTRQLRVDDVVFCRVHGRFYLHKVTALDGNRVQIGNNHGRINGWTNADHVYGLVIPQ